MKPLLSVVVRQRSGTGAGAGGVATKFLALLAYSKSVCHTVFAFCCSRIAAPLPVARLVSQMPGDIQLTHLIGWKGA